MENCFLMHTNLNQLLVAAYSTNLARFKRHRCKDCHPQLEMSSMISGWGGVTLLVQIWKPWHRSWTRFLPVLIVSASYKTTMNWSDIESSFHGRWTARNPRVLCEWLQRARGDFQLGRGSPPGLRTRTQRRALQGLSKSSRVGSQRHWGLSSLLPSCSC